MRERDQDKVNTSLKQQHAAGQKQPPVNRHAPLKISYCTLKGENGREKHTPFVQIKGTFQSREIWKDAISVQAFLVE